MKLKRRNTREDKEVLKKGLGKNRKATGPLGIEGYKGGREMRKKWGEIT